MNSSIRGRLTASLLVALVIVITAAGVAIHSRFRSRLLRDFDEALLAEAQEMFAAAEDKPAQSDEPLADALADYERIEQTLLFEVWSSDGTVLIRSERLDGADLQRPPATTRSLEAFEMTLPDGRSGRGVSLNVAAQDWNEFVRSRPAFASAATARFDGATIVVAHDLANIDALLRQLRLSLAIVMLVAAAVTAAAIHFMVRRELAPLERLAGRAAAIRSDELSIRFAQDGAPRELLPIHHRLDKLLERLERAYERERRFTSAVAHELRTPVAELKTICEVALRWPTGAVTDSDGTQAAGFGGDESTVRQAGEIAGQMESLITHLLALRRAESASDPLHEEPTDVAAIVRQAFSSFEARAAESRLACDLHLPRSLVLVSDKALLAAIVTNLVSNAIDHAPPSGRIRCELDATEPGGFQLDVTNAAPDLDPDDLPHLFEPFWRKDSARSDGRHAGLGLTLAHAFADRLGMRLSASLRDEPRHGVRQLRMRLESAASPPRPRPPEERTE